MTLAQTFTVFTPEIWSSRISEYFRSKLLAAKFFDDYSGDVAEGGDQVHIPKLSDQFAATDIKTTSGDITATDLSDTSTTLSLDNWKGVAFKISDFQARQIHDKYNVIDAYGRDMAYKLAKKVDTDILAQSSNITASVGNSATSILATSVEKAISIMESNSVPLTDCAFFFHPKSYWQEVMSIQKYYDASQFGVATLPYGSHDMLYGIPVFVSEQIPAGTAGTEGASGHRNFLIHREALIFAFQPVGGTPVRIRELPAEAHRRTIAADVIYGKGYIRANAGVRIISKK